MRLPAARTHRRRRGDAVVRIASIRQLSAPPLTSSAVCLNSVARFASARHASAAAPSGAGPCALTMDPRRLPCAWAPAGPMAECVSLWSSAACSPPGAARKYLRSWTVPSAIIWRWFTSTCAHADVRMPNAGPYGSAYPNAGPYGSAYRRASGRASVSGAAGAGNAYRVCAHLRDVREHAHGLVRELHVAAPRALWDDAKGASRHHRRLVAVVQAQVAQRHHHLRARADTAAANTVMHSPIASAAVANPVHALSTARSPLAASPSAFLSTRPATTAGAGPRHPRRPPGTPRAARATGLRTCTAHPRRPPGTPRAARATGLRKYQIPNTKYQIYYERALHTHGIRVFTPHGAR